MKTFFFIIGIIGISLLSIRGDDSNNLACKVVFKSMTKGSTLPTEATLQLINIGSRPAKICTLNQIWRGEMPTQTDVLFTPEIWKSDAPTKKQLSESIKILEPREIFSIPFKIDGKSKLTVTYQVSPAFGEELGIWHGKTSTSVKTE